MLYMVLMIDGFTGKRIGDAIPMTAGDVLKTWARLRVHGLRVEPVTE